MLPNFWSVHSDDRRAALSMLDDGKLRFGPDLLWRRLRNRDLLRNQRRVRSRYVLRRIDVRPGCQPESERTAEHVPAMLRAWTESMRTRVAVRRRSEVLRKLPGKQVLSGHLGSQVP
jgi:branched-subunit amino acid aminotransferase/4-amino-4-deoxychorismate lyase